jgi:hypothetical protein
MLREKKAHSLPGLPMVLFWVVVVVGGMAWFITSAKADNIPGVLGGLLVTAVAAVGLGGIIVVNPNQARVLQLFGNYTGTLKEPGLHWINPFSGPRRKVSLRVRNFESGKMKVNDL